MMPAEQSPRFPNPDLAPRLALYPITGGGVALDWRIDPVLIEQAHSAFAAHQPVAKLYLRRIGADGTNAALAEAASIDLISNPAGQALFQQPLTGTLQAEIGLEGQQGGGWLLLARSNRLDAVPEAQPNLAQQLQQLEPAASELGVGAPARSQLLEVAPATQLPVEYPILAQSRSVAPAPPAAAPLMSEQLIGSCPAEPLDAGQVPADAAQVPAPETALAQDRRLSAGTRFPDPSLAALAIRPELRGTAFPLPAAPSSAPASALANGDRAFALVVSVDQPSEQRLDQHRSEDTVDAEQVLLDQQPPNRQDVAPSEWPATGRASSGSGPLAPYPSKEDAVIQGELHLFGSAAPGSLLDLGGHPYRVGPGGRFSFRVALDDPELLAALLQRLPRLPVAERDA